MIRDNCNKMSSQRKLDVFFGGRKRPAEESLENSPSRIRLESPIHQSPVAVNNTETPKKVRVFRAEWLKLFPWLEKIDIDNKARVICTWCRDAKKKNPFATIGSTNFQSSAFSRHESNPEHLLVADSRRKTPKLTPIPVAIDKQNDANDDASDKCKTSQMRTLYHIAKNGQPLSQYNGLIDLQRQNDCPHLQDKSKLYTSEGTKMEMLSAINETIVEEIDSNLRSSKFIGIIVDESTDVTVYKKLNMYFRCLKKDTNEPVTHFIECVSIPDGKANTKVQEIKVLEEKEFDYSFCVSLASDGAAVMMGKNNGVGALLRREVNPRLVQVHCVAHRVALAAGQACRDVPYFNEYQATLKMIYRFYNNSAVRYNELRAMEVVLEDENMRRLTLKEPASFRWLSLDAAVTAVLDVYPALVKALENEAAGKNNTEAKGLFNRVRSITFLLSTGFLKDVLNIISKLSKIFQRDNLDVSVVNTLLESTIERLTQFKSTNGKELEEMYSAIKDSTYKQVKLLDKQVLRIQFQNSSQMYIDKLLENLADRFEDKSMHTLQLMNAVLNPNCVPSDISLLNHGLKEVTELSELYGQSAEFNGELLAPLVDADRMSEDYEQFKIVLKSMKGQTLQDVCTSIVNNYSDVFPDFATLAKITLVSPITSVACERGFSSQNRLKHKNRSNLKHETVNNLIRIMEEGPSFSDFDPISSVRKFLKAKRRQK